MLPMLGDVLKSQIRRFSVSPRQNLDMVGLLQSSIKSVKDRQLDPPKTSKQAATAPKKQQKLQKSSFTEQLNTKYRSKFRPIPPQNATGAINGFFHTTQVKLEWSSANFLDIPGERKRHELETRLNELSEKKSHLKELQADEDQEFKALKLKSSTQDFLPEIVFLGKCNVGKSTLLNSLLSNSSTKEASEFAFASRRAGFTQTMNCFNIGKRFRLIDTPGYGVKGKESQGKQIMEYLHNRKQLRRVYLLVSGTEGFSQDDFSVIDILVSEGVPFEIVFTKIDKIKGLNTVHRHIKESEILELPTEPNLIFTNSDTNKKFPKRDGLNELRFSIFEVCGLKPDTKPLKIIKE